MGVSNLKTITLLAIVTFAVMEAPASAQDGAGQSWRNLIGKKEGGCTRALTDDEEHWYYDCSEVSTPRCKKDEVAINAENIRRLQNAGACATLRKTAVDRVCGGYSGAEYDDCERSVVHQIPSATCGQKLLLGKDKTICIKRSLAEKPKTHKAKATPNSIPNLGTEPIPGACSVVGTC